MKSIRFFLWDFWYYVIKMPYWYLVKKPYWAMKRKIPFVRQFKKNDELDALTARLSLLYRNGLYETKSVPKEFFAILKTGDGAKLKSYLAPYVDKMKGEKTIQYYNRCYLENESDRCYIAAVIIIFKL